MTDAETRKPDGPSRPPAIRLTERTQEEIDRLAVKDRVIEPRSVIVGLIIFSAMVLGAFVWRVSVRDTGLGLLEDFQFSPETPKEEPFELKDPQQELLREQREKIPEEDVEERPDIQITTRVPDVPIEEEVVKVDQIEPREEVPIDMSELDIEPTPEELDEQREEIIMPLTPIAAISPRPADMFWYKEPAPADDRAVHFLSQAPEVRPEVKLKPVQFGDQDAPAMGELGSVDVTLFGDGAAFRNAMRRGYEARHSVDLALRWLALHQEADGSWHGSKWNPDDVGASGELDEAGNPKTGGEAGITGMALMAFLGGGHTVRKGEYRSNVLRGLEWVLKEMRPNGQISGNMYEQALCTIALCEAYGRAPDERIQVAARQATDFCVKAVGLDHGWRYTPNVEQSDMSVTAWFIQALKSARLARINFDDAVFQRARAFVDGLTHAKATAASNGTVAYTYGEEPGSRPAMTAAAMVIRQFTGMGAKSDILLQGADYLRGHEPDWDKRKDFYLWYYATYAMHNMGAEHRVWWNSRIRNLLLEHQMRAGHQQGSWSPVRDQWAERENAGRAYCTALGALCLEVYYRYGEALQTYGTAPDLDDLFFQ